jgi:hypothetical protein
MEEQTQTPAAESAEPTPQPTREQLQQQALERAQGEAQPAATTEPEPQQKPEEKGNIARTAAALRRLELEKKQMQEELQQYRERASVLDKLADPESRLSTLEELGVKYEDLTTDVLRRGGMEEDVIDFEKLPKEVREKLQKVEELERQAQERAEAEKQEQAQRQHRADVEFAQKFLDSDDYPLANALGAAEVMVAHWNQRVEKDPDITPQEVAAEVEKHYATKAKEQIQVIAKTDVGMKMLREALGLGEAPTDSTGNTPEPSKPPATTGESGGSNGAPRLSNESAADRGDGIDLTSLPPNQLRERAAEKYFGRR